MNVAAEKIDQNGKNKQFLAELKSFEKGEVYPYTKRFKTSWI